MTYAPKRCHECAQIIVPKRPLEIVEIIKQSDALLEAEIQRVEQELVDKYGHKWWDKYLVGKPTGFFIGWYYVF